MKICSFSDFNKFDEKFMEKAFSKIREKNYISFYQATNYIHLRDSCICQLCGKQIPFEDVKHIDHILPKSKFGHSYPSNLQTTCPTCNMDKSNQREFDEIELRENALKRTIEHIPSDISYIMYKCLSQHYKDKNLVNWKNFFYKDYYKQGQFNLKLDETEIKDPTGRIHIEIMEKGLDKFNTAPHTRKYHQVFGHEYVEYSIRDYGKSVCIIPEEVNIKYNVIYNYIPYPGAYELIRK